MKYALILLMAAGLMAAAPDHADPNHYGGYGAGHYAGDRFTHGYARPHGFGGGGGYYRSGPLFYPSSYYSYYYAAPAYYYPEVTPTYVAPPDPPQPPETYVDDDSGNYCREFSQQIQIDGQTQESYGTACLQPDGTWRVVQP